MTTSYPAAYRLGSSGGVKMFFLDRKRLVGWERQGGGQGRAGQAGR
jgi:hypothetical protein